MATTKPRITVTLPERHHEVLARLSAASGESMSQIVAGFVEIAVPSLERVVVVMERARAAPQEVRAGLTAALDRADRELMPQLLAAVGQNDLFLAELDTAVAPGASRPAASPRPAGAGSKRPRKEPTPVPVTRGSGGRKVTNRGRR